MAFFRSLSRDALLASHAVLLVVIAILGIQLYRVNTGDVRISRDMSGRYTFTNPILDFEDARPQPVSLFSESVSNKIGDLKKKYGLSFASVYFRDLNNGQWLGVNEKEEFASASLAKLPIAMALYKQAEANPLILDKRVTVLPEDVSTAIQVYKPSMPVKAGETYSLRELTERMIEQSDNTAADALVRNIDTTYREEVFNAIGVHFAQEEGETMIDVKDYASFFRVLFNSTYLNRDNSETVLKMLSKVTFTEGIPAGLPPGFAVAHKFGERSVVINGLLASTQLHDCGIVYYPQKPYLLCVMTRANDFHSQEQFIADISSYFYGEVSK